MSLGYLGLAIGVGALIAFLMGVWLEHRMLVRELEEWRREAELIRMRVQEPKVLRFRTTRERMERAGLN